MAHSYKRHYGRYARKYSDEQIDMMEKMRGRGMNYEQIAIEFNTKKKDIEQQLGRFGSTVDNRVLKVPMVDFGRFEDVG